MAGPQPTIDYDAFNDLLESGAIREVGNALDLTGLDAATRKAVVQLIERQKAYRARITKEGREEERAAGLLPKRGRPRKNLGAREPNGRASRRKADANAASFSSRAVDALWQMVAQGRGGAHSKRWLGRAKWNLRAPPPTDPLFLNIARRGELDLQSFAKAVLWWATRYSTRNKHLLFKVIFGKPQTDELQDRAEELDAQKSKERRQIALLSLGDDFVHRLDAAIFDDKITDVESLKRDIAAVWQAWCSFDFEAVWCWPNP